MVNDKQVKKYRQLLQRGITRSLAALAVGMDRKTARKWEAGHLPSEPREPRTWRTRADPLDEVWASVVVPLLQCDQDQMLQATTILDHLKETKPGEVEDSQLRTLQRRVREWRALYGHAREVFFEQEHPPGREAQVDFTDCSKLAVTILGVLLEHKLFELELSFSGRRYVEIAYGETFEALKSGLQSGFWSFGGVPRVVRSDNLSAATHELPTKGRGLNPRFEALLAHYGVESTRIEPGKSNQNGGVERGHGVLKTRLDQALRLRGSRDFPSVADWMAFVATVVEKLNRRCDLKFTLERPHLLPLPSSRIPDFTELETGVSRFSLVRAGGNAYSVPARLIGHRVTVRLYPDEVLVLFGGKEQERCPRLHGQDKTHVNYRHVIPSLVRKPGAFARYRWREALFPSLIFRRAYDALKEGRGERADAAYLKILELAATTMECDVEAALEILLDQGRPFDFREVQSLVEALRPQPYQLEDLQPLMPCLNAYDDLLEGIHHAPNDNEPQPIAPAL